MASGSGARGANLNWEKFEELAKVAFVADPHADTRFFLKTRVVSGAKAAKGKKKPTKRVVQIVARVSTRPRKNDGRSSGGQQQQQVAAQSIQYQTPVVSNLSRLTRLLRFVMQEVLGPMKPAFPTTAAAASTNAGTTQAPQTGGAAPPSDKSKSKSKKKKKGGKK